MIKNEGIKIMIGENRFYLKNNIIYVTIVGELNEDIANTMKDAFYRLLDKVKYKSNIFVDNSKTGKPSPAARKIFKEMMEHNKVGKIAIFGMNTMARIIASFVVGMSKKDNVGIFKNKEKAFSWLIN